MSDDSLSSLTCKVCGKKFSNTQNRARHMKTAHNPVNLKCDDCGFETNRVDNFTRHRNTHKNVENNAKRKSDNAGNGTKRRGPKPNDTLHLLTDAAEAEDSAVAEQEKKLRRKYASNLPMTLEEEYEEMAAIERVLKLQEEMRRKQTEELFLKKINDDPDLSISE